MSIVVTFCNNSLLYLYNWQRKLYTGIEVSKVLRLKEMRKAAGLTMRELGQKVGVTESTVSLYESGKREPSQTVLMAMAEVLSCSVDYLLGVESPAGMSDFTYAMHNSEADLTDRDKEILLQMAKTLAEANRRDR